MAARKPRATFALILTRTIPASPEKIYGAWTKPSEMKKWYAPGEMSVPLAQAQPRVGGRWCVRMKEKSGETHTARGVFLVVKPGSKLVMSWGWDGEESEESPRMVSVQLRKRGRSTELTLTHTLFTSRGDMENHRMGWQGCLENLARRFNR